MTILQTGMLLYLSDPQSPSPRRKLQAELDAVPRGGLTPVLACMAVL